MVVFPCSRVLIVQAALQVRAVRLRVWLRCRGAQPQRVSSRSSSQWLLLRTLCLPLQRLATSAPCTLPRLCALRQSCCPAALWSPLLSLTQPDVSDRVVCVRARIKIRVLHTSKRSLPRGILFDLVVRSFASSHPTAISLLLLTSSGFALELFY